MNSRLWMRVCVWAVAVFSLVAVWLLLYNPGVLESPNQVCFHGRCLNVEVVQNETDRTRGLQHRKTLGENAGMLFVFSDIQKYSFWMKDTFIPLDMIWLDYAKRVVHVERNVPPCRQDPCPTYAPSAPALYVLETNPDQFDVKRGDQLEFRLNVIR